MTLTVDNVTDPHWASNWVPGRPNDLDKDEERPTGDAQCATLDIERGAMYDARCSEPYNLPLCQFPCTLLPSLISEGAMEEGIGGGSDPCPPPPVLYGLSGCLRLKHAIAIDSCFTAELTPNMTNFTDSRAACEAVGGFLAAPYTPEAARHVALADLPTAGGKEYEMIYAIHGILLKSLTVDVWVNLRQKAGQAKTDTGWYWTLPDGTSLPGLTSTRVRERFKLW